MNEIKAGVLLSLKDQFSQGIKNAGSGVEAFQSRAASAIKKVDQAFSGLKTAAGAIGVSFSVGSAAREIINLDAKMTAFGTTMNMSAERVNKLKQSLFDTAVASNVKIGTDELMAAMDSIAERTGDAEFIEANMRNLGIAIRATGAAGSDIGGLYSEIQKMGLSAEEAATAVSTLAVQGNNGAFVMKDLASLGPRTIAAYTATGRSGTKALVEMGAALQVIRRGTGSSEQAATAFEAVMRNLTSPDKQQKLKLLGVEVRDGLTKEFRPITEIMTEIVEKSGGSLETLGTIFDSEAVRAFNSAIGEYQKTGVVSSFKEFNDMLDDGSYLENAAARNANTLAANLKNVQTAFVKFVNSEPIGVLEKLNKLFNYLSENPERFNKVFGAIAVGLTSIVAVKGAARIIDLISGIKNLKSGGGNMTIGSNIGGNGMPVYVTNWGGKAGASPFPSSGSVGKQQPVSKTPTGQAAGTPLNAGSQGNTFQKMGGAASQAVRGISKKQFAGAGALAAVGEAMIAIPRAKDEIDAINADETMSKKEKATAKGGAVGDAAGSVAGAAIGGIGGMAAGAAAGAAIGSIVPGLGTAAGLIVGGLVGLIGTKLGGMAGRKLGEKIGSAVAGDDEEKHSQKSLYYEENSMPPFIEHQKTDFTYSLHPSVISENQLPPEITNTYMTGEPKWNGMNMNAELSGTADVNLHLTLDDNRTMFTAETSQNTARNIRVNTGSAVDARSNY